MMGLKILGVGLSKTGTHSLAAALNHLGYRCLHWAPERLTDILIGEAKDPHFLRYDDVDAVVDIPAAHFYREIGEAYPDCKFILTLRDCDDWFEGMVRHVNRVINCHRYNLLMSAVHDIVYGCAIPNKFLYQKAFNDHNRRVVEEIQADRLLKMNIIEGDGWPPLCGFLNRPIPTIPFPCKEKF